MEFAYLYPLKQGLKLRSLIRLTAGQSVFAYLYPLKQGLKPSGLGYHQRSGSDLLIYIH